MLNKRFIKKALFSAFFYCCQTTLATANESIFKDLDPKVKSFVVLNYYNLMRESKMANPVKLNEIILELDCKNGQFNKENFLNLFAKTKDPIAAVRLIEKIEALCSK